MSGAIVLAAKREETGAVQNLPLKGRKERCNWRLTPPKKFRAPLTRGRPMGVTVILGEREGNEGVANETMTNGNKQTAGYHTSPFWRILRGEAVYQLDETSVPEPINRALGPDPFWDKGENIMCFDDLEVGLDETNELKTVRYFGLYPGKTSKGEIRLPKHDSERISKKLMRMSSVMEYLMTNSVGFNYDRTFDSNSDRGIHLHDGISLHFYEKSGIFYLGAVFLTKI
ncbi:hypothetical protein NKG60_26520 [Mesorhizobium sp. M1428]|uniref:hypothetical protein n=1 Tax=unclassified Mesorhizobium TaxID=325217 RepID=UPI0033354F20